MSASSADSEKGIASQASSTDETNYLFEVSVMRGARATLAMISFMLAAAAVGCEANVLHTFYSTNKYDSYWLSVWPSSIDVSPTEAMIATSAIMLALNLGYFVASLIPYPRPHIRAFNVATAATGIAGMIITVAGVAYSYAVTNPRYLDDGTSAGHSIRSWTCTWETSVDTSNGERIESVYPFERLCRQSESSLAINLVLAILSFSMLVSAAIGYRNANKMELKRSGNYVEKEICGEVSWN